MSSQYRSDPVYSNVDPPYREVDQPLIRSIEQELKCRMSHTSTSAPWIPDKRDRHTLYDDEELEENYTDSDYVNDDVRQGMTSSDKGSEVVSDYDVPRQSVYETLKPVAEGSQVDQLTRSRQFNQQGERVTDLDEESLSPSPSPSPPVSPRPKIHHQSFQTSSPAVSPGSKPNPRYQLPSPFNFSNPKPNQSFLVNSSDVDQTTDQSFPFCPSAESPRHDQSFHTSTAPFTPEKTGDDSCIYSFCSGFKHKGDEEDSLLKKLGVTLDRRFLLTLAVVVLVVFLFGLSIGFLAMSGGADSTEGTPMPPRDNQTLVRQVTELNQELISLRTQIEVQLRHSNLSLTSRFNQLKEEVTRLTSKLDTQEYDTTMLTEEIMTKMSLLELKLEIQSIKSKMKVFFHASVTSQPVGGHIVTSQPVGGGVVTSQPVVGGDIVVYDDVMVNRGGAYNSSTGEFTCPVDGIYLTEVHLSSSANMSSVTLHLWHNSNIVFSLVTNIQDTQQQMLSNSATLRLVDGDTLHVTGSDVTNTLHMTGSDVFDQLGDETGDWVSSFSVRLLDIE